MEGIVAKRKDSVYRPGKRSADWLKIKSRPQQEFVVGGFTEGKGSRKHLGALLLGAYRNGQLHYFGHSGSGFSENGLRDALDRMKPLFTDKSPFENPPRIPEKIQWVKPKLVCEIYAYRCRGHAQKTAQENRITSALLERFRNLATSRKTQLGFIVFDCVTCQVGDFLYYPLAILW